MLFCLIFVFDTMERRINLTKIGTLRAIAPRSMFFYILKIPFCTRTFLLLHASGSGNLSDVPACGAGMCVSGGRSCACLSGRLLACAERLHMSVMSRSGGWTPLTLNRSSLKASRGILSPSRSASLASIKATCPDHSFAIHDPYLSAFASPPSLLVSLGTHAEPTTPCPEACGPVTTPTNHACEHAHTTCTGFVGWDAYPDSIQKLLRRLDNVNYHKSVRPF